MTGILIGSFIFLFIALVLFIVGLLASDENFIGVGTLIFILDLFFGFGMLANCVTIDTQKSILQPDELAKSEYTLYVKCEGQSLNTTDHMFLIASNDLVRVEKILSFNSYGKISGTTYQLVVLDGEK